MLCRNELSVMGTCFSAATGCERVSSPLVDGRRYPDVFRSRVLKKNTCLFECTCSRGVSCLLHPASTEKSVDYHRHQWVPDWAGRSFEWTDVWRWAGECKRTGQRYCRQPDKSQ